jgi:hypothetical protein
LHGEIDLSEIDYLIIDEGHSIYPENPTAEIMIKFYYNSKEALDPMLRNKLPKILTFFNIDSVI